MKNVLLKYEKYRELKNQLDSLTLERLIYKVTKELSLQYKIEWIRLDNIIFIIAKMKKIKITEDWIDKIVHALIVVSENNYCKIEEKKFDYFTKATCIKILK